MSLNDVFPFEPYMHVNWMDYGSACIVVECYLLVPQVSYEINLLSLFQMWCLQVLSHILIHV